MLIAGTKKPVIYTQNGSTQNAKVMKKQPIIISANILRRETTGSTTPNLLIKENLMQEHIIDLSERYALKLNENHVYILYKIELNENGTYQRKGAAVCKDLPSLLDKLIYCELMNEKVETLEDMRNVLHAIHSEVTRIAENQATYAQA
jgi:uncharacterized 10.8 kDa protein in cox-rep intergenic region